MIISSSWPLLRWPYGFGLPGFPFFNALNAISFTKIPPEKQSRPFQEFSFCFGGGSFANHRPPPSERQTRFLSHKNLGNRRKSKLGQYLRVQQIDKPPRSVNSIAVCVRT